MSNRFIHIIFVLVLNLCGLVGFAQPTDEDPPDPAMSVYVMQNMNFGAFSTGAGGTITLSNSGSRSSSGGVVLLNQGTSYFQAIFEIMVPVGTIVTVTNGPNATLTGSNGGSVSLSLGNSSPASPFSTTAVPPSRTAISVGGTLTVGNTASSPPGNYSGTFAIYFHYQ